MSDKESDNYYRLITLVVNTGTRTLREVFKKHTGDDSASVLKKHRQTIDTLKNGRKRVLTEPQYQLLIANTPDLETFDISLLVILIQNICTNVETPSGKGWFTYKVPDSDTTVGGYIIRIRSFRNEVVGHSSATRVSNASFKSNWAEVEECLKGLAAHVDKDFLDEIAKEIKNIESMQLTADSNTNLETTLKKWRVEELYTELAQLNEKADEQANHLKKTMDDVSAIRTLMEGGQHTGNRGSTNQQMATVFNNYILLANTEMNQTKDVIENKYDGVCKALGIYSPQQQQTKALPPIDNQNALTEEEIIKYSKQLDMTKEVRELVKEAGHILLPEKVHNLLRTMLQKWHDVVARCENENPRDLLAASFACISDNRTAVDVLGDGTRLEDVKKMKPRPETTKKIIDIDFDVVCFPQTIHHFHHLGPSFEIRNWTNKALEHQQQQPCITAVNTPDIDKVDEKMDES